jgi:hypothetical protein
MDVQNMTEEQAVELFYEMKKRFQWRGVIVARGDVGEMWETRYDETMSGDAWEAVRDTYAWRKMDHILSGEAFGCLAVAVADARQFLPETDGQ